MTFKVGDKVRCIEKLHLYLTEGKVYEVLKTIAGHIRIVDDTGRKENHVLSRFELVQEDKLPHELLGLDRYRVVKKDESDPLWELFWSWYVEKCFEESSRKAIYKYYGYDDREEYTNGFDFFDDLEDFKNNPTLITLAERDRCVNKKPSQTKQLSEKYTYTNQVLRSDGVLFTPDEIGGEKVSDIKERYNKDRSLLRKHKDLFGN